MSNLIKIVTHSGKFHADESLGVFMLRQLSDYKNSQVIRTRDPSVIESGDIVIDVGGVYDAARHRYDHHQRGFVETFSEKHSMKLSSAGLIYKHFGKRVISSLLGWEKDHQDLDFVFNKLYDDLIEGFDGNDNGVMMYPENVKAAYKDPTNIAARVSRLNPSWTEESTPEDEIYKRFEKAVEITGAELVAAVENIANSYLPGRSITKSGFDARFDVDPSGKIIVLPQFCPYKSHLTDLEEAHNLNEDQLPLYVLFADQSSSWRIQAIAIESGSFVTRKALPEPWRGVRDEELSTLTGVPGCIFIHASGFIGGAKTKDAVLRLAKLALE